MRSVGLGEDKTTPNQAEAKARAFYAARTTRPIAPEPKRDAPRPFFVEPRALRTPEKRERLGRATKMPPAPPSAAIIALTRAGFGPTGADVAAFGALGATQAERLEAWVDQQLDPASIDDSACDARVAQSNFTALGKTVQQYWQEHNLHPDWQVVMQPFWETQFLTFLRAIHSRRQLFEKMVGFWHDHFNVYGNDQPFGPMFVELDRDVIRAHALGNFRDLVIGTTRSIAMLFYLDNAYNSNEDVNENFARELLELHTLGSDHYFGSIDPSEVPLDGDGVPAGYTESDVIEAARCLTGWTVDSQWVHWLFTETGRFRWEAAWHDDGTKRVVGLDLAAGGGEQDGHDLVDWLCRHPATARFVAGKLCRRFVGDSPPQAVIDAAAAAFLDHVDAPDQLARVMRVILLHPSFLQTWGDKVKRPFEIAVSMFRSLGVDLPFTLAENDNLTGWFYWEYYQTGQPLFGWNPPNGYPDDKASWNTSSPRVMCWRLANMILSIWDEAQGDYLFDIVAMTPPGVRSPQALVDHWVSRLLGRPAPAAETQVLVDFLAQEENPNVDLDLSTWEDSTRLRALVSLVWMSPSFLFK